jgi:hypothetical protein
MPKKPPTPEPGNAPQGVLAPPEQRHPSNAPVVDVAPETTVTPETPVTP